MPNEQETYPPATRLLPTSDALKEAQPSSMQELFSRNPEYMTERNIDDIVLHMRDLRVRLEATATPPRHARVKDPNAPPTQRSSRAKGVDMNIEVDFSQLGIKI